MSKLDLYLRVLIEGLLENELVDKTRLLERTTDRHELRYQFCLFLLLSLDMSIWDPVVRLATTLSLALCEKGETVLLTAWFFGYYEHWSKPKSHWRAALVRIRTRLLLDLSGLRIEWYILRDSMVPTPEDTRRMTLPEWERVVLNIFRDVLTQMRRAAQIDAETEHRLHTQVPLPPSREYKTHI